MHVTRDIPTPIEFVLQRERDRLVRLCAHLTGDPHAAEDLAQEFLIEAWRQAGNLRDPDAITAWLSGIARNVCLRWLRREGREVAKLERLVQLGGMDSGDGGGAPALDGLERKELASLLSRALETLPPVTHDSLVLHIIHGRSQADIARIMGISENAASVRIHGGKRALRQALAQPGLLADAIAYGLVDPNHAGWQETRIWCPLCGRHRIEVRMDDVVGVIAARCSGACAGDGTIIGGKPLTAAASGMKSVKSILRRELIDLDGHYRRILATGESHCARCGQLTRLDPWPSDAASSPSSPYAYGVMMTCRQCGAEDSAPLSHLLLDTPLVQRFWGQHPRLRVMGVRSIQRDGRDALVCGFASAETSQVLEVVSAADTFEILYVNGRIRQ